MKKNIVISDIVVRAYSWHKTEFGVVIEAREEEHGKTCAGEEPFMIDYFTVMWDSGNLSTEMWEELIHYDEYVSMVQ